MKDLLVTSEHTYYVSYTFQLISLTLSLLPLQQVIQALSTILHTPFMRSLLRSHIRRLKNLLSFPQTRGHDDGYSF